MESKKLKHAYSDFENFEILFGDYLKLGVLNQFVG